ncbi:MAG: DNA repair protein RecN [Mariprofundaceae bacterium]|nr:DNA repair protein RecN [Mariprofundaceae bacterium]
MLTELKVREFGLMEDVRLEFSSAMTVFTGETGAGKSLLVDALGAVFGARASSDWVRHGAERAELNAVIENNDIRLQSLLEEQEMGVDEPLFLRRVINADGRSRAWLNGVPVPLKLLQQIGAICLDLHGQHEHQGLMQAEFQQQLVDSRVDTDALLDVKLAFECLQQARKQLNQLQHQKGESTGQAEWMRSELEKLSALDIQQGLEENLISQVETGQNIAQIQQAGAQALLLLDEGDEGNVRSLLAQASHAIEPLVAYHAGLQSASDLLAQVDALLSEIPPYLNDAQEVALDAEALQSAEDRLAALREAMRRHDMDEVGLLALMDDWQQRLSLLDTAEWDEAALNESVSKAEQDYCAQAKVLSGLRTQAIGDLVLALRPYLDRLGMPGMQVEIEMVCLQDQSSAWHASGWDDMTFMLSSNPGEPFRPLAQVASGGELSRLVLSLKACGAFIHAPAIAVFDEVDVGIGGETAWCVGELLVAMGNERQVFVVSHLPQVASCAQHHISILKTQREDRTITDLAVLQPHERVAEIARMLGGVDTESLEHAKQMLHKGQTVQ